MAAELRIEGVRKVYGQGAKAVEVLQRIDLSVAPGEFLILVGPSGCGKSTLLNLIAGLETPSHGRIVLGGRDVTHAAPAARDIAMVFQSYALYPTMSVADNIGFALEMRGVPLAQRQQRIAQVAALLQIEPLLARRPSQLSGGQRQRVAMGRALARDPQLFLFDEPLSNLDAKLRVDMRAEIKRLHQQAGITSVYVTHDQVEAMTLGSRIAVMKDGVLQQVGTPNDIYRRPANTYVAGFIGSPAMNFIAGQADLTGDTGTFSMQDVCLTLRAPRAGALTLGVRPEHLRLDAQAAWRAQVQLIEPTGADTFVVLASAAGPLHLRVPPETALQVGQNVGLSPEPAQLSWFDASSGLRVD